MFTCKTTGCNNTAEEYPPNSVTRGFRVYGSYCSECRSNKIMTDLEKFGVRLDKLANDYALYSEKIEDHIDLIVCEALQHLLGQLSKEIDSISKEG